MNIPKRYPRMRLPGLRYPAPELEVPPDQQFVPGSAYDPLDDMADDDLEDDTDDDD